MARASKSPTSIAALLRSTGLKKPIDCNGVLVVFVEIKSDGTRADEPRNCSRYNEQAG